MEGPDEPTVGFKVLHPAIAVDAKRIELFKNELLLARRIRRVPGA